MFLVTIVRSYCIVCKFALSTRCSSYFLTKQPCYRLNPHSQSGFFFFSRRPPTVSGGGGSTSGFGSSCRRRPKARDSLRFSHIILTKCHKGLGNKQKGNKTNEAAVAKHLLRGRRKEDTKQQSSQPPPPPHKPSTQSTADLQRGDGKGGSQALTAQTLSLRSGSRRPRGPELRIKMAAASSPTAAWSPRQCDGVGRGVGVGGSEANRPL